MSMYTSVLTHTSEQAQIKTAKQNILAFCKMMNQTLDQAIENKSYRMFADNQVNKELSNNVTKAIDIYDKALINLAFK